MTKEETYAYLNARGIEYEITNHPAVFNMAEVSHIDLPYPEANAKNLFVRDSARNFFLITVQGEKRVDLKLFRAKHGTKRLSFTTADELLSILGLTAGSVSPLGILKDEERKVHCFIDKDLVDLGRIGMHPNDNTATVWLRTSDLIDILRDHGNTVEVVEL
ncbi:prolyl-tRNA synthetase associated domain-containing protein [Sutterella sp.]|uniref:prolyl-tRNA synthetase associated domain-containing protein n=1 Tax=Sutterella sp. TaxID=1981025 RepID=UPI0026DF9708|nr:prolyl-tRNA synthetase associated domain-containing protein [Sutterella sp.]MDO5532925.1 prolyl-tRNA synthetase associated domain-containing protein [Sutterella sp.]